MKPLFCDCCGHPILATESIICGPYEMCPRCARIWRRLEEKNYEILIQETRRIVEVVGR